MVEFTNVMQVFARNDECVTGVKLPKIYEGQGELVFPDDTSGLRSECDLAEDAFFIHESLPQI